MSVSTAKRNMRCTSSIPGKLTAAKRFGNTVVKSFISSCICGPVAPTTSVSSPPVCDIAPAHTKPRMRTLQGEFTRRRTKVSWINVCDEVGLKTARDFRKKRESTACKKIDQSNVTPDSNQINAYRPQQNYKSYLCIEYETVSPPSWNSTFTFVLFFRYAYGPSFSYTG